MVSLTMVIAVITVWIFMILITITILTFITHTHAHTHARTHTHTNTHTHTHYCCRISTDKFRNITRLYFKLNKISIIFIKQHKGKKTPFENSKKRFVAFDHKWRILTGYFRGMN